MPNAKKFVKSNKSTLPKKMGFFLEIFFIKIKLLDQKIEKNIFYSFFGLDWMTKFRAISRVFLID